MRLTYIPVDILLISCAVALSHPTRNLAHQILSRRGIASSMKALDNVDALELFSNVGRGTFSSSQLSKVIKIAGKEGRYKEDAQNVLNRLIHGTAGTVIAKGEVSKAHMKLLKMAPKLPGITVEATNAADEARWAVKKAKQFAALEKKGFHIPEKYKLPVERNVDGRIIG
ncbi:hypothetical protein FRB94_009897 [Tulasnella sp. JGI-2019a]|nr:hypothetical protein FRB94_009897 [Tulasnella sp. JGI-2019a]